MKRGIAITILMLMVLAAGCSGAKQVKVIYKSNPLGGTLYKQNGEAWGTCPKPLWYDLDEEAVENGYLDVKGLTMRWPTGPEKRSGDMIRIRVDGTERRVIFTQPKLTAKAVQTSSE